LIIKTKNPHERRRRKMGMKSIVFVLWILIALLLPLSLDDSIPFRSVPGAFSASKPSLMTTEQEVRGFFGQYVERYNQRDVEEFLSLFSSRAKQNQQDGLPEIRRIYSDFFSQMISLQNSMEDMKIEIYQNAAEVKARYVVTQVLKKEGEKRVLKGSARWVLTRENGTLKILSIDYKHDKTP
jgi:ketosteroid isomerase-like protein